ncbi:triple tyrosine motif-containing protein [Dokdonia genika]|uniref:Triple tyrosine motif-containing protein n=1 Tax=Dokdonia genika TaxID=308113 RepID=A0ABV9L537_9FLAO
MNFVKNTIFLITIFITSLLCNCVLAQELPPIQNFEPSLYGADNQNWQVSQGDDGIIYFANNKGLLQYNGAQWSLRPSPNETILRSVAAVGDRVYTGAHMDFGFWEEDRDGILQYTSLSSLLSHSMIEGEQIWKIISYKDKVLLQSLNGIYVYNPKDDSITYIAVATKNAIFRLFEIDGYLLFQEQGKGLFIIENGQARSYDTRDVFQNKTFIGLYQRESYWLGVTQKNGIFKITPTEVTAWAYPAASYIKDMTLYRSIELSDQSLVIGTVASGLIKLSKDGTLDYQVTQNKGLGNNTVLAIYEDQSKNIWVGLDNGIACINTTSPVLNYYDEQGRLGTTYVSAIYNNALYLGTNQGLFYRDLDSKDFKLVPGTEEQVWDLKVIQNILFCGHNNGTYIVEKGIAKQIAKPQGTWTIRTIPDNPNLLLQGNYDGLYVLEKSENGWQLRNKIKGFDISSRYFEFISPTVILVNNEYKGVYRVEMDSTFKQVSSYDLNPSVNKGEHSSLSKFDNTIYYANKNGIYKYNDITNTFSREDKISAIYDNKFVSGKLINDESNKMWAFTDEDVVYFSKDPLDTELSINKIYIPQRDRNAAQGFENITSISSNNFLLGTSHGYLIFSPYNDKEKYSVHINRIENNPIEGTPHVVSLFEDSNFSFKENNISFNYHVAQYDKFKQTSYQYRLLGFYDEWSEWTTSNRQEFANVSPGSYTFEVRAKVGDNVSENVATYNFTIDRPWYTSYLAIILYTILAILVFLAFQQHNKRRYKRKQDQALERTKRDMDLKALAVEKENIELRNQNLRDDISARNRELATSTLAMVNKSKTLKSIKEKLSKLEPTPELKAIIKDIDKNISTNEDWAFFEKAFNHADKDFFKKVKEIHPELTANDLKLCVYLRLNLSSKEIAPLLNISHRSVEIKRYRLRKKINLDRSIQLNDYFIKM